MDDALAKEGRWRAFDRDGYWCSPGRGLHPLARRLTWVEKPQIRTSVCAWIDLLGFGADLFKNNWSLDEADWGRVGKRLVSAYRIACSQLEANSFLYMLNDGIVRVMTPSEAANAVFEVSLLLRSLVMTFLDLHDWELGHQLPGSRAVVAAGSQMVFDFPEIRLDDTVFDYTRTRSGLSRVAEIAGNPIIAFNPVELQMNTAFSKAYTLDQLGTKAGLPGPGFYVDESLIHCLRDLTRRERTYVWIARRTKEGQLFAVYPSHQRLSWIFGLLFELDSVPIHHKGWSTTVRRLKAFYPHDEDPTTFRFDLPRSKQGRIDA